VVVQDEELTEAPQTDFAVCPGEMVTLDAGQEVVATYLWSAGQDGPEIDVSDTGIYTVTITSACSELVMVFTVEEGNCANPNVFIPNVFSPNRDNINDGFRIEFDKEGLLRFEVSVYDRWGAVVFTSGDPAFEWLGDYLGRDLNPGVYVYRILIEREGERPLRLKGDVTLVR
jgi:gliding motility-associated-like protein